MLRVSNPVKVQEWTGRLFRFKKSAVSVAQFCDAEGVSVASFYQWKRKLRDQASSRRTGRAQQTVRREVTQTKEGSAFQAVQLVSSRTPKVSPPVLAVCLSSGIQVQVADNVSAIEAVMREVMNAEKERSGSAPC
ncbi:MAG TPA: hypothetical protein EYM33_12160 [Pseudomonadales bacterium]|nr:hypothetical protein [Pseudomonadales bacterium]